MYSLYEIRNANQGNSSYFLLAQGTRGQMGPMLNRCSQTNRTEARSVAGINKHKYALYGPNGRLISLTSA